MSASELIKLSPSGQFIRVVSPDAVPLAEVAYVDLATDVPEDEQTGSINFPFSTIAQAIAAMPTGGTIMVAPGNYGGEGALVFPGQAWTLQSFDPHPNYPFGTVGAEAIIVASLAGAEILNLIGVSATGTVTTTGGIGADSCFFADDISALFLDGFDCRFLSGVAITVSLGLSLCDSRLDAAVINVTVAGISRFVDCELNTSFAFTSAPTGSVFMCGRTNYFLQNVAGTITNATLTVQATPGQNVRQPTPIAASGALGVIDLSAVESGGVVILQPSANYNIDGFTAKPPGFTFDLFVDSTNLGFIGTLNQEIGATATQRIRNPNNQPYPLVAGQLTRIRYTLNRWRVGAPPSPATQAIISVAVPALAAGVLGYVDVSLVGSAIAGAVAGSQVIASPQADLAAAGAGGGHFVGCRMSATNNARMSFVGTLAAGSVNFLFTRL